MSKRIFLQTLLLIAIVLLPVLHSCTTVPLTGRKQVTGLTNTSEVLALSAQSYQTVLDSANLVSNSDDAARVKRVGNRIKTAVEKYMNDNGYGAQLEGFNWEFNLIDEDVVNAWAMPGGKVAFYTGIMPICRDDAGVAVVMGHEVAHAIAKHGQERMNQGMLQNFGAIGLSVALQNKPAATQNIANQAFGLGSTVLGVLPFSRLHESEADELGLTFMAIAGYDPREAPQFWERMAAGSGGGGQPEFLSTHPSHETRISRLNAALPKALEYYEAAGK
ncbi:MAG: M48 family metallopeptidase [Roseivirga sp.]